MIRGECFPTLIYQRHIRRHDALNEGLARDIRHWRTTDPIGHSRTERGEAWHSRVNAAHREAWQPLVQEVLGMATEIFREHRYAGNVSASITEMWANIHDKGGSNVAHIHTDCLWSGVYWVSVPPGSGDLTLKDPRAGMDYSIYADADQRSVVCMAPTAGTMIMFPAWLEHAVEEHMNETEERISVSFNIKRRVSGRRTENDVGSAPPVE